MAATHVTVAARKLADPQWAWGGSLPRRYRGDGVYCARSPLGIHRSHAKGQRVHKLADGSRIMFDIITANIEIMGEIVVGTDICGDAIPLLGLTALESVGTKVGPVNRRLQRLAAVRMKELFSVFYATREQRRVWQLDKNSDLGLQPIRSVSCLAS